MARDIEITHTFSDKYRASGRYAYLPLLSGGVSIWILLVSEGRLPLLFSVPLLAVGIWQIVVLAYSWPRILALWKYKVVLSERGVTCGERFVPWTDISRADFLEKESPVDQADILLRSRSGEDVRLVITRPRLRTRITEMIRMHVPEVATLPEEQRASV